MLRSIGKITEFASLQCTAGLRYYHDNHDHPLKPTKTRDEQVLEWKNDVFGTEAFSWLNDIDINVDKQKKYLDLKNRLIDHGCQTLSNVLDFEKIIRICFLPEDIEYFVHCDFSAVMKVEDLAKGVGEDVKKVEDKVEELCSKGLMYSLENKKGVKFCMVPDFVGGWYETTIIKFFDRSEGTSPDFSKEQIDELMTLYHHYHQSYMIGPFADAPTKVFRYAPYLENKGNVVYDEVKRTPNIHDLKDPDEVHYVAYEEARRIIEEASNVGVMDCVCKNMKLGLPENRGKTLEEIITEYDPDLEGQTIPKKTCLLLNFSVDPMVKTGVASKLEKEEALSLLKELNQLGHVHAPENTRWPLFMCNCHKAFCTLLQGVNDPIYQFCKPAQVSRFVAEFDTSKCTGCGDCVYKCPTNVLSLDGQGKLAYQEPGVNGWCLGCNLCGLHCPETDVVKMVRRDQSEQPYIPIDRVEWQVIKSFENNKVQELFFANPDSDFQDLMREIIEKIENLPLTEFFENSHLFKPVDSLTIKICWLIGTLMQPFQMGRYFKDGVSISELIRALKDIGMDEMDVLKSIGVTSMVKLFKAVGLVVSDLPKDILEELFGKSDSTELAKELKELPKELYDDVMEELNKVDLGEFIKDSGIKMEEMLGKLDFFGLFDDEVEKKL